MRQQIEVANKLRALSAQGEYENLRDQNTSRDDSYPAASQTNREVYMSRAMTIILILML